MLYLVVLAQGTSARDTFHTQLFAKLGVLPAGRARQRRLRRCVLACWLLVAVLSLGHCRNQQKWQCSSLACSALCADRFIQRRTTSFQLYRHIVFYEFCEVTCGCDLTETKDLCRDRAERMPHYPNITRAFGRAHTVHHHGKFDLSYTNFVSVNSKPGGKNARIVCC